MICAREEITLYIQVENNLIEDSTRKVNRRREY